MKKDSNIILRVEEDIKNRFQQFAERNETTMSSILTACIIDMLKRDFIPINIRSKIYALEIENRSRLDIAKIKRILEEVIHEAKLEEKISKVYLFGSYSRGEETNESDIDIRVEHMNHFDLFDLSEMSYLLKQKTGKEIDIATQETSKMDPSFYESIRKDEICIYEHSRSTNC